MLEAEATEADAIANIRLATRVPHARTVPLGRRCISSFHMFERDDERKGTVSRLEIRFRT
jgi:hypothetical protein